MDAKYSQRIKDILSYSKEEAIRLGNPCIGTEHLFLGTLREGEGLAVNILETLGMDLKQMKKGLEDLIKASDRPQNLATDELPLLKSAEKVLKLVYLEAQSLNAPEIDSEHLLLAILKDKNNYVTQMLEENSINYNLVKTELTQVRPRASKYDDPGEDDDVTPPKTANLRPGETPVLDNFGTDLTRAAEEGRLDPIIGREREIERVVQILSRRKKNNPILIGEPGVGKSAIVEGLAARIVAKKVSRVLFGKRIVALDLASIVAGTKYRGQFEERIKSILNELARTTDVILFIDELHTLVGAGSASGSLDAANMLKPALARGEIQCIGATTLDEYRQYIERDGALERRFQKIMVEPTSSEETLQILNNIKARYEDHHKVIYTPDALSACVTLTNRYISDRHLPDKAIDALDEAGSRVHISNIVVPKIIESLEGDVDVKKQEKITAVRSQNFELAASLRDEEQMLLKQLAAEKSKWEEELMQKRETVTDSNVEEVVAMMTGIPVTRIAQAEGARLLKMRDSLKGSVVGQEDAIDKVVKAIQRNRAGLKDPNKPIGTFIFLGPTGVGKTQLAKVLANYLFDGSDSLIRVDMSEYMEKFSVSRLIGAPPGYIGYEEGGQLTEKVRRKPYAVILLDEIEKAHPDVFHLLLQVLDEGQLTDSLGRKIDFKNTIIIMTSNIGTRELKDFGRAVGFSTSATESNDFNRGVIQKALQKAFAPEFLNRIDDIIFFNSLERAHIHQIIDIELKDVYKRIENIGLTLKISDAAKDFIAEKGFDIKFGARPLKRAIQKHLEDPMAESIIQATVKKGDVLFVDLNETKDEIKIEIGNSPS
jgi:ATP-dependent Clp protease ATP-binding subunit ClpC